MPRQKSAMAIIAAILVVVVGYFTQQQNTSSSPKSAPRSEPTPAEIAKAPSKPNSTPSTKQAGSKPAAKSTDTPLTLDDGGIAELFRTKDSDTWVEATGRVQRLLSDDKEGERHQKFLIAVSDAITVLVSHNIDAAPRVPVREGDYVRLRGEYEYSDKGGIVHFTHKPKFRRKAPGGWIEHQGTRYE
jgi:hypothetical protein